MHRGQTKRNGPRKWGRGKRCSGQSNWHGWSSHQDGEHGWRGGQSSQASGGRWADGQSKPWNRGDQHAARNSAAEPQVTVGGSSSSTAQVGATLGGSSSSTAKMLGPQTPARFLKSAAAAAAANMTVPAYGGTAPRVRGAPTTPSEVLSRPASRNGARSAAAAGGTAPRAIAAPATESGLAAPGGVARAAINGAKPAPVLSTPRGILMSIPVPDGRGGERMQRRLFPRCLSWKTLRLQKELGHASVDGQMSAERCLALAGKKKALQEQAKEAMSSGDRERARMLCALYEEVEQLLGQECQRRDGEQQEPTSSLDPASFALVEKKQALYGQAEAALSSGDIRKARLLLDQAHELTQQLKQDCGQLERQPEHHKSVKAAPVEVDSPEERQPEHYKAVKAAPVEVDSPEDLPRGRPLPSQPSPKQAKQERWRARASLSHPVAPVPPQQASPKPVGMSSRAAGERNAAKEEVGVEVVPSKKVTSQRLEKVMQQIHERSQSIRELETVSFSLADEESECTHATACEKLEELFERVEQAQKKAQSLGEELLHDMQALDCLPKKLNAEDRSKRKCALDGFQRLRKDNNATKVRLANLPQALVARLAEAKQQAQEAVRPVQEAARVEAAQRAEEPLRDQPPQAWTPTEQVEHHARVRHNSEEPIVKSPSCPSSLQNDRPPSAKQPAHPKAPRGVVRKVTPRSEVPRREDRSQEQGRSDGYSTSEARSLSRDGSREPRDDMVVKEPWSPPETTSGPVEQHERKNGGVVAASSRMEPLAGCVAPGANNTAAPKAFRTPVPRPRDMPAVIGSKPHAVAAHYESPQRRAEADTDTGDSEEAQRKLSEKAQKIRAEMEKFRLLQTELKRPPSVVTGNGSYSAGSASSTGPYDGEEFAEVAGHDGRRRGTAKSSPSPDGMHPPEGESWSGVDSRESVGGPPTPDYMEAVDYRRCRPRSPSAEDRRYRPGRSNSRDSSRKRAEVYRNSANGRPPEPPWRRPPSPVEEDSEENGWQLEVRTASANPPPQTMPHSRGPRTAREDTAKTDRSRNESHGLAPSSAKEEVIEVKEEDALVKEEGREGTADPNQTIKDEIRKLRRSRVLEEERRALEDERNRELRLLRALQADTTESTQPVFRPPKREVAAPDEGDATPPPTVATNGAARVLSEDGGRQPKDEAKSSARTGSREVQGGGTPRDGEAAKSAPHAMPPPPSPPLNLRRSKSESSGIDSHDAAPAATEAEPVKEEAVGVRIAKAKTSTPPMRQWYITKTKPTTPPMPYLCAAKVEPPVPHRPPSPRGRSHPGPSANGVRDSELSEAKEEAVKAGSRQGVNDETFPDESQMANTARLALQAASLAHDEARQAAAAAAMAPAQARGRGRGRGRPANGGAARSKAVAARGSRDREPTSPASSPSQSPSRTAPKEEPITVDVAPPPKRRKVGGASAVGVGEAQQAWEETAESSQPRRTQPTLPPPTHRPWLDESTGLIRLEVSGRGAERVQVVRLPVTGGEVEAHCAKKCKLALRYSGKTSRLIGVDVQQVRDEGPSLPMTVDIPIEAGMGMGHGACPGCNDHLQLQVKVAASREDFRNSPKGEMAYVVSLWLPDDGDSKEHMKYIIDALVLGHSLNKHCRVKRRVMLVTKEVMKAVGAHLLHFYWEVREVEHVTVNKTRLNNCEERFRGVFTKLRVWELTEFEKVLLMDVDTLVLKPLDDLFMGEAPMAMFRGNAEADPGTCRAGDTFFDKNGENKWGINAGVMLIRPDKVVLARMFAHLKQQGEGTRAPEQDFLSWWFCGQWRKLAVKYNYQLHQLHFIESRVAATDTDFERRLNVSEVCVAHYSGKHSPHDYLLTGSQFQGSFNDYLAELAPKYGSMIPEDTDRLMVLLKKWHDAWREAWRDVLANLVEYTPYFKSLEKCPLCGATEEDDGVTFEHCFYSCQEVLDLYKEWKQEWKGTVRGLRGLREQLENAALYPSTLKFVDQIARMRFPRGCKHGARVLSRTAPQDDELPMRVMPGGGGAAAKSSARGVKRGLQDRWQVDRARHFAGMSPEQQRKRREAEERAKRKEERERKKQRANEQPGDVMAVDDERQRAIGARPGEGTQRFRGERGGRQQRAKKLHISLEEFMTKEARATIEGITVEELMRRNPGGFRRGPR